MSTTSDKFSTKLTVFNILNIGLNFTLSQREPRLRSGESGGHEIHFVSFGAGSTPDWGNFFFFTFFFADETFVSANLFIITRICQLLCLLDRVWLESCAECLLVASTLGHNDRAAAITDNRQRPSQGDALATRHGRSSSFATTTTNITSITHQSHQGRFANVGFANTRIVIENGLARPH